jgi:hypothetical protein
MVCKISSHNVQNLEKIRGSNFSEDELYHGGNVQETKKNLYFRAVLRIRCIFDPWIRDPEWVKNPDPESGYRDEQHGSYF